MKPRQPQITSLGNDLRLLHLLHVGALVGECRVEGFRGIIVADVARFDFRVWGFRTKVS